MSIWPEVLAFFPALRGRPPRRWLRLALLGVATCGFLGSKISAADIPAYARQALAEFNPTVPAGWAYTVTTKRNDQQITERFDPAQPPDTQWTLVQTKGRAPTADESATYARGRSNSGSAAPQAAFLSTDIAAGSLVLVHEDEERGEFTAGFRAESAHGNRMLNHLSLHLFIARRNYHVEKYTLEILAAYSPVLTVKMQELHVEATFDPPADGRPSLPAKSRSLFKGSIFFFSVQEDLQLTYADFSHHE